MKKTDAIQLFEMLKTAYPAIFSKKARDVNEVEAFVNLYYQTFGNEDFETVRQAMAAKIIGSKFPPTISELVEQVQKQKDLQELQAVEEKPDDDLPMSQEDQEAFENALIAFSKA